MIKDTIQIVAAVYLLFWGLKMETANLRSFVTFKFAPILLAGALGLLGFGGIMGWPLG